MDLMSLVVGYVTGMLAATAVNALYDLFLADHE